MYDREGNLAGIADPINKPSHYNTNTIEIINKKIKILLFRFMI